VHIDYHVEVDRHYYSVPYQLVKHAIEIRLTAHTVECFFQGNRAASHVRAHLPGRHTTLPEHMPTAHRQYAEWTPERLVRWAEKSGPATAALIQRLLERRTHPQQGFRSALGIMRLGKSYGADRLEAACARALELGALSYRSLESILRQGLDRTPVTAAEEAPATPAEHEHLRGARYYH
jgi:transposase